MKNNIDVKQMPDDTLQTFINILNRPLETCTKLKTDLSSAIFFADDNLQIAAEKLRMAIQDYEIATQVDIKKYLDEQQRRVNKQTPYTPDGIEIVDLND